MQYPSPALDELTVPARVVWGARYAVYGVRIVATHPSVWWMIVVPMLVTIGLFVFGFWGLGVVLPWLTTFLWTPRPEHAAWVWMTYRVVLWTFRLSVAVALAVLLYLTAGLVATPFNDLLSQRVEREVLGTTDERTPLGRALVDLFWSIVHSALSLTVYLAVMLVAFLFNLVPGVGSAVSFVVGALASGMFFSREAMDGCLSRRRMTYARKWRVVAAQWPVALGFGLTVSLLMWIPFLNFLALPMSVAGGTLMFCHLERDGRVAD